MSISKYRLTENDVQEMVMSTAKRILENKQLLEGVVNEMREGKSAINEDRYYGTPDYSNPPSFFSGERNFGPQMPGGMPQYPYPYMPMPRPMMPPMGPPPGRPGGMSGMLKYLLFRNYINNHINALGDYYHGVGGTHESPSAGGGSGRSGGRGGYGGGRGGSRGGGAPTPGGTSGGTSGGTDGASGGTSGGTASTTPVIEVPPKTTPDGKIPTTAPVGPDKINVPTPPKPIMPPVRRDPVVGGGGGGSNINRSSSHDNTIHGSHNQISNDDHSSRVDNSVNSHNTTTNVNQTQNYDQRSSVNNNNVHIGGDRIIGNRRGGGGGRPSISRHGHDHGPRRDFDGNGGGMRHRGHGGYDSGRGGRGSRPF